MRAGDEFVLQKSNKNSAMEGSWHLRIQTLDGNFVGACSGARGNRGPFHVMHLRRGSIIAPPIGRAYT